MRSPEKLLMVLYFPFRQTTPNSCRMAMHHLVKRLKEPQQPFC